MVRVTRFVQAASLFAGVLSAGSPPLGCLDNPCLDTCKQVLDDIKTAYKGEQGGWVSDVETDPFYQSPHNLSSYHPGDLIRLERPGKELSKKYQTPPGLILYRMLYQSADMENQPVPASAFILLPYTARSDQSLKLIAWAHGTSGIERHCAPSVQADLYYEFEAPFSMALQGFAVVAPDYAGQGTNTPFHYLAGPAHAADVVHAVAAARAALPPNLLSTHWVVVGHSEGGLTAWATNEREAHTPSHSGFLGAVSIAPALANLHIIRENLDRMKGHLGDTLLYSMYTLTAIARLDKSIDPGRYVSALGSDRDMLAKMGCFETAVAAYKNLEYEDVFSQGSWISESFAEEWEARTGVRGDRSLAAPMLLVASLGDVAVPFKIIEDAFYTQCTKHHDARVKLSRYPSVDHETIMFVSQVEYFDWIEDLFNGSGPIKCENATMNFIIPGLE